MIVFPVYSFLFLLLDNVAKKKTTGKKYERKKEGIKICISR